MDRRSTLCKIRGFLICVYRKPIGNVTRNVVGNLSKPKDTACFHVFCGKLRKNLVILPCPGVSLPKKHHVSLHFPLRKPHILRSRRRGAGNAYEDMPTQCWCTV